MDELNVNERSWSVGLFSKKNFELFNVVSGVSVDVNDQRLLTGGNFEADLNHLLKKI